MAHKQMNILSQLLGNLISTSCEQFSIYSGLRRYSISQVRSKFFQLIHFLLSKGVNKYDRVVVDLERDIDAFVTIYSILACGCTYVPLNSKDTNERKRLIICDVKPKCIITDSNYGYHDYANITYNISEISACHNGTIDITTFIFPNMDANEVAAVLYTSGTTGMPKGIMISYASILAFVDWLVMTFHISYNDRILATTPINFDLSFLDLFAALRTQAAVYIPDNGMLMSPKSIIDYMFKNNLTLWYTVPSLLGFILGRGGYEQLNLPLRCILFAGEVFQTKLLARICDLLPNTAFYNLFGPTETNVCLFWKVDKKRLVSTEDIPIGVPASGNRVKIDFDNDELLVKGPTIMSGYWPQKDLTKLCDDGWYRTGDIVYLNSYQEYCFRGRKDRIVKVLGHRIDLAGVETLLNGYNEITEAAVVCKTIQSNKVIIAFLSLNNISDYEPLIKKIRADFPAYMLPSRFIKVDKLPRLLNGKTDYQNLIQHVEKDHSNAKIS